MHAIITKYSRFLAVLVVVGLFFVAMPVNAATSKDATKKDTATAKKEPQDISGAVTQSYSADPSVQVAMIVQIKAKDATTVVPLTSKESKNVLGVVIPTSDATIVLTPEVSKQQQVLVATSGKHSVIVSNQNGQIKVGDYVAISAIDGVGMKASDQQDQVIGKAAGNFTGTSNVIGSVKIKDSLNKESGVALGRIEVDINISHNPLRQKTVDFVPAFLAGVAVSVADKPVSVARIYLASVILLVTALLAGNMLYSGIRGGMIAVGRNPLSKKSIIKSLIQTVLAGLIVFVVGIFAVYLLLKL
ncbi:MAG: rane protein of unknown function [Candidatus Saccharibacteria bacterium]|nr:rane protein of unknown function [Candidatus Saccharibacteria bacterium]